MQLSLYISDLLYEHDCVTIPGFGSFLGNYKSAHYDLSQEKFSPPFKQISFNSQIKDNDGILAKYVSKKLDISFDEAIKEIHQTVLSWSIKVKTETIVLKNLGEIYFNSDHKMVFVPDNSVNHLKDSFGLSPIFVRQIKNKSTRDVVGLEKKKPIKSFYKTAAVWTLLIIGLGAALYTNQRNNFIEKQIAFEEEYRNQTIEEVQKAVFNFGELPPLTINVKVKKKKYFIIAGAFRINQNAKNLVSNLKRKGYDATILGLNDKGLSPVSFSSFTNRKKAVAQLRIIQRKENKDAWIFESF
tara:strand:- start:3079 stop:3975 length:897 start_codon:yes stop_codon:yes gene_type:complete